jgi:AraC-like DNA-binding protein
MELATDPIEASLRAASARSVEPPPLPRIEHAMVILRTHLLECAAQDDWGEHRAAQLIDLFRTCIGHGAASGSTAARSRVEAPLPRHVLRQVFRFVNEHLDTKLKWDDIALEVGMHPFAFGRRFKVSTGLTVRQYVIRCRLRRAMKLLMHSRLKLSEIAFEVGFSCQSHMTSLFRQHLGTTPRSFRTRPANKLVRVNI